MRDTGCNPQVRVFRNMNGNPAGIPAFHHPVLGTGFQVLGPGTWDLIPGTESTPRAGRRARRPSRRTGYSSGSYPASMPRPRPQRRRCPNKTGYRSSGPSPGTRRRRRRGESISGTSVKSPPLPMLHNGHMSSLPAWKTSEPQTADDNAGRPQETRERRAAR